MDDEELVQIGDLMKPVLIQAEKGGDQTIDPTFIRYAGMSEAKIRQYLVSSTLVSRNFYNHLQQVLKDWQKQKRCLHT